MNNRTLIENIAISGTEFSLVYSSEKVSGRTAWRTLEIPVTSSTPDSALSSVNIKIGIAGKTITQSFPAMANQVYTYLWDGNDHLGNPVAGAVVAKITRDDVYTPAKPYPASSVSEFKVGATFGQPLGTEGWTIDVLHSYDSVRRFLNLGDGTGLTVESNPIAGGGFRIIALSGNEIYDFDSLGRHIETKTGLTGATKFAFTYNAAGRLASVTDSYGNLTTFTYDSAGKLTTITAPFGQVTTVSVDSSAHLISVTDPASETHALAYYSGALLHTFTKPSGVTSTFVYDGQGLLFTDNSSAGSAMAIYEGTYSWGRSAWFGTAQGRTMGYSVTQPSGGYQRADQYPSGYVVTTLYSANGNQTVSDNNNASRSQSSFVNDPRFGTYANFATAETYRTANVNRTLARTRSVSPANPAHPFTFTSLTESISQNGGGWNSSVYTSATKSFANTSAGGRTSTTVLNAQEDVVSYQAAALTPLTFTYDTAGRITQVAQGTGRVTSLAYASSNGQLASVTNPLSEVTSFTYDAAGRISTRTLPDSRVVAYTYDSEGNTTSVTPPSQPAHSFTFNGFDLPSTYSAPGTPAPVTTYAYNNDRQLTSVVRPSGATATFNYHTTKEYLTSVATPLGTNTYTYNTTGILTNHTSFDGVGGTVTNAGGSLTSVGYTVPGGSLGSVNLTYNSGHKVSIERLTTSGSAASNIAYAYDADYLITAAGDEAITRATATGLVTQASVGPNLAQSFTYSAVYGEPSQIKGSYGSSTLYQEDMLRDALGRITSRTEAYGSTTNAFEYLYDLSGRLTEVKLGGVTTSQYGYDGNSNRTSQTVGSVTTSATYNSRDELLTFGTRSYTYNANGERISMTDSATSQTTAYGYDTFGNLKSVTLPGGSVITYLLNSNGQRVAKKVGSTVQMYYMYGKNGELVATVNPNKTVNTRLVYGIHSHVPDYIIKGTTKYQLVKNHLGSPVQVVDSATGTIAQEIVYDEWGRIVSDSSPGFQPFGFAGCKYDVDTQLCNFRAREYDASVGRWLTKDPIMFNGGDSNLYGYVVQDPVNYIDSAGQSRVGGALLCAAGTGVVIFGSVTATTGHVLEGIGAIAIGSAMINIGLAEFNGGAGASTCTPPQTPLGSPTGFPASSTMGFPPGTPPGNSPSTSKSGTCS